MHNYYPLAPEKLKISHNMLSNYCVNSGNDYRIKIGNVNNLVPNLGNERRYVLYYKKLKLYLSLGMKLFSVYRVLKVKQFGCLKIYIDFNTDKRKDGANTFEKDFFNLMNNSVYDITIENLRKIISARLINNANHYKKYVSQPSFIS